MADIQLSRPALSTNDSAVLQALFDAESSPSSAVEIEASLPPLPPHVQLSREDYATLQSRELCIVRTLQPENVPRETIDAAVQHLDALIAEYPTYPSAYVNRAQALRMRVDLNKPNETVSEEPQTQTYSQGQSQEQTQTQAHTSSSNKEQEGISQILENLHQAISLATPRSPADPVSPVQARILADAHTHRGYLLLQAAKRKQRRQEDGGGSGPERWRAMDADQLEEMASRDFFFGGRYGNPVAQQLAVQTNPYAKMCGAIVKEAMREELST